ncbi:site-specific integrase [Desulfosarcina widdelii]|uniref:Site-specific integrase n=1 Tax=Desulfosarcina widdelii TaxID=947919 RepID=A0A5K7ZEW3_9BACT|nr:site-specific integrase [Desulfosarcina widdelii]BBO74727.1 site-specific integrase [Desulfosarcina widdelii]
MGVKVREKVKGSGEWWIYIDHQGKRKAKKVGRDKRVALEAAQKIEASLILGRLHLLEKKEPTISFKEYADQWLEGYVKTALKASTYRGYKSIVDKHLKPQFGKKGLHEITRVEIKQFLFKKIKSDRNPDGLTLGRVKRIKAALSGLFTQAIEDELVKTNPASRLDKILNAKDQILGKEISPYKPDELEIYLTTCEKQFAWYYPFFLTLSRTGMRLGEGLGLRWSDIDFRNGIIEIKRGLVEGNLTTPKYGKTRIVQMTPHLSSVLNKLRTQRKEHKLKYGWSKLPEWVFVNEVGEPLDPGNLRGRVHYKLCEKAELRRIRIHDLRHTYATIL